MNKLSPDNWMPKKSVKSDSIWHWARALDSLPAYPNFSDGYRKTMYQRYKAVEKVGLLQHPCIVMPLKQFLKRPNRNLAPFKDQKEEEVLASILPFAPGSKLPEVYLAHLHRDEAIQLAKNIAAKYPADLFRVCIQPYRKVLFSGNITVNSDGSIHAEFVDRGAPSQSRELLFTVDTPQFLDRYLRFSTKNPLERYAAYAAISKIPKVLSKTGPAEEYLPGYYEVSISRNPRTSELEAFFYDYRDKREFTM